MTRNLDGSPKPDSSQKTQTYLSVFNRYFLILVMVFGLGAIGLSLSGCKSSSAQATTTSAEETPKQAEDQKEGEQQKAVESPKDLNNLEIGQTAVWDNYSITIDSVELDRGNTLANVTMVAKKDSKFASRYLDGFTNDGKQVDAEDIDDVNVIAGESYKVELSYPSQELSSLKWDNWSNEATWHFDTSKLKYNSELDIARGLLSNQIKGISYVNKSDYTPESYAAYEKAVNQGEKVLNDDSVTPDQVTDAAHAITSAESALVEVEVPFNPDDYVWYNYSNIARRPKNYLGKKMAFSGEVVDVDEHTPHGTPYQMTIAIDDDHDEKLVVVYDRDLVDFRILEDDYITVYGEGYGTESSLPAIRATQIEVQGMNTTLGSDGVLADGKEPETSTGTALDPSKEQIVVDGIPVWIRNGTGEILGASDDRSLTANDLADLSNVELWLARNEVYARHGQTFKTPDLQNWFNQMPFYKKSDSPTDITKLEEQNVDVIQAEEARRGSPYAK